jgi:beta-glucosidase
VVYAVGAAGAEEVKENNIAVWLTPAVNIHRSPLCGRNFEYYSEDPFLTGKLAGAMVKGIQSQHIAACVKHFALNNKETNRKNSDSRVSERAAREIYLRAFKIIVEEAEPWSIMTSYNIINGHRASESKELLEDILRNEWGWKGMVTTDWWTLGEHYKEIKAGNDLKMGCGFPDRIMKARELGLISRQDMTKCAGRILELILKLD